MKEQLTQWALKMSIYDLEDLIKFCQSEKLFELMRLYVHVYRMRIEKDF